MASDARTRVVDLGRVGTDAAWRYGPRARPFHTTLVVTAGAMRLRLDGRPLRAGDGDVVLCRRGEVLEARAEGAGEHSWLGWQGDAEGLPELVADRTGRIRALLSWCEHDRVRDLRGELDLRQAYVELLLREHRKAVALAAADHGFVDRVLNHITRAMDRPLALDDLAAVAGMGKWRFLREWKRARGLTPIDDLRRLRVERARRLIMTTDLPLKEIPARVGLADESHLGHLFRRVLGRTPGSFRRGGG